MKVLLIIVGVLLAIVALAYYGYLVPLACGMNSAAGCSEDFGFFTQNALVMFWPVFLLGVALTSYGIIRK